ncbi:MAG TPA: Na-translocating system protein MpsC family protein [Solirubrobacteraceae bacterium]|nr:Na-translocating system protein MpsC family protein [Solirubrobacteraceae bacterium]
MTTSPPDAGRGGQADRPLLQAISNEMVRLFKEQFGRGPTRARTEWAGPDTIVTILEETLTPAERNLVDMGEHERLRETRMFFQYASTKELCEPIERLTGRKVRAFISGMDTVVDGLSVELFVLHPAGSPHPSRTELAEGAAEDLPLPHRAPISRYR